MNHWPLQAWFLTGSTLGALLCTQPITAQVVPDNTLPGGERSQVTGNPNFQIDGGARRGSNLFHSFQQFSVPTGGSAYFNNAAGIRNILTRVTGGSISNIDGLIRANGAANLFLLNPNGIIFGPNASLNIGGSFIGTTANSINFADGFQYSATNPQTPPLLTVSVPVGLQMGTNPGQISLQGNGYDLSVAVPFFSPIVRRNSAAGLWVPVGQTLALIGGDIAINGGTLTAEQGRIELGSVRSGQVSLSDGFALSYSGAQTLGDIHLSRQALADASGGGSIQVQGNQVSLADGSIMLIQNQGAQAGGSIRVNAAQSLKLSGSSPDGGTYGGLTSETVGVGRGADITVSTQQLIAQRGAATLTRSYGSGDAGNVTISASDFIQLIGRSPINRVLGSVIGSGSFNSGDGGAVTVSTGQLSVLRGATVSTAAFRNGNAGNVTVNATRAVEVIGVSDPSLQSAIASTAVTAGVGDAGEVTINTAKLVLQNGNINSSTVGTGNGGSVTVNASEYVEISGAAEPVFSYIGSAAPVVAESVQQAFQLPDRSSGNSGSLTINTPRLSISDGANITVSNNGTGNAGTLRVNANSIVVNRGGSITAATVSGEGGNINLNVRDFVLLRNNSSITASAAGTGNGGNIQINASRLSLLDGSRLLATVSGVGDAGDITVSADAVQLSGAAQLRTSTSSRGQAGNITINTPNLQLSGRTSGLFAGTTSTGDAGNLTIQPRGSGQDVRVELDSGAQISASTASSGRGGRLTITAPESITLTGNGSIISAETSGEGVGGNLTLQAGDLNIQNQAEVSVSSVGTGSAGSLFVEANRIFLNNQGRVRADTSGGGGNINLRSGDIILRRGSNITTNATGINIPGGDIAIDTRFLVAVPNEDSNISADSEDFRGGNVSINAFAIFGLQSRLSPTDFSDITATGANSALSGTVNVTTAGIDPTSGLVELSTDLVDPSGLIAQACPANQGNSFVVTGRGGLPPTPEQQLDDDSEWQDRRRLTVAQQTNPAREIRSQKLDGSTQTLRPTADMPIIEATGWQVGPTGEVILVAATPEPTMQNMLNQSVICKGRQ
ncbi:filamentous hemagglutinin N-terminal domain-containing protein [Leptolyngbya sp. FACHB-261]|uniref:two-partner secretion domain-containing protein n=1 Tax=Leptolyngbya sp. FACHB-261 TaxID=2692806 RepID=UPI00168447E5|nr:filamentous hemagglutinin N-terminal domain-containing protein [Leptolyngbya sp. FACHB-261]MBD2100350.1 filamentous hemagglutinin N-terminal domain-containing protein [Leptolyngbya sp. FACHB-261]